MTQKRMQVLVWTAQIRAMEENWGRLMRLMGEDAARAKFRLLRQRLIWEKAEVPKRYPDGILIVDDSYLFDKYAAPMVEAIYG